MSRTLGSESRAKNLAVIGVIIAAAISLSIISYQYSQYSAAQIEEISIRDTKSNAEIQANDLGNSLTNKLQDTTSLLQVIAASRPVQESDLESAASLFDHAALATSDVVDFYMWLDKEGRIVWISNLNQTGYEQYRGLDLSYRLYFSEARSTRDVYYSSVVDSNDRVSRLYISHPIIDNNSPDGQDIASISATTQNGEFKGIVAAGIRTDDLGRYLESQISPDLKGQVGLADHTGIILYSKDTEYTGKNVFGVKFQTFLQSFGSETAGTMSSGFKSALQGNAGSGDITFNERSAFVYTPIQLRQKLFGVLYIVAPYSEVAEVNALVESQKNLSILLTIAIAASAVTAAVFVLQQNKHLERMIDQRTAQLREANEQLTINDKLQKEFINIAAHELRTPVQPILGMSEILESELGERREEIGLIARNARRLERLTQDILDVSKIESGSMSLNKQTINLDETISSVVKDFRNSSRRGNETMGSEKNHVDITYEPRKIIVHADSARVQQVMFNLISNALKFTAEGEVTIRSDISDGFAKVAVRDTGTGVDPEIRPRLFQKFATKSERGTGLGLFISKSIVEAHGGRMWAEDNNAERGATFYFTLPLGGNHNSAR